MIILKTYVRLWSNVDCRRMSNIKKQYPDGGKNRMKKISIFFDFSASICTWNNLQILHLIRVLLSTDVWVIIKPSVFYHKRMSNIWLFKRLIFIYDQQWTIGVWVTKKQYPDGGKNRVKKISIFTYFLLLLGISISKFDTNR